MEDLLIDIYEAKINGDITDDERNMLLDIIHESGNDNLDWWEYIESLTVLKITDINKIISRLKTHKDSYIEAGQLNCSLQLRQHGKTVNVDIDWCSFPEDTIKIEQLTSLKKFVTTNYNRILNNKTDIINELNKSYSYNLSASDNIWDKIYVECIQVPYGRSYDICMICGNSFDKYHEILIYCKDGKILYID